MIVHTYNIFPPLCPMSGVQMFLIVQITGDV